MIQSNRLFCCRDMASPGCSVLPAESGPFCCPTERCASVLASVPTPGNPGVGVSQQAGTPGRKAPGRLARPPGTAWPPTITRTLARCCHGPIRAARPSQRVYTPPHNTHTNIHTHTHTHTHTILHFFTLPCSAVHYRALH